jgi:FtsP/CotA-like multicopper oxidase with cupredoxin domain
MLVLLRSARIDPTNSSWAPRIFPWNWARLGPRMAAAGLLGAVAGIHLCAATAVAQAPAPTAPPPPYIPCPEDRQPLIQIPELVSQNGKLNGTILLTNGKQRLNLSDKSPDGKTKWCLLQNVRQFRSATATIPPYPGTPPQGYPGVVPTPPLQYLDPVPGPTLRARLGDLVQLSFVNTIDPGAEWRSIDRGERGEGCDQSAGTQGPLYPGPDMFPDCFHGSSTGNIHYHGTHTNPGSTGDNVFIEVRPSLRQNGQPVVDEKTFEGPFREFFAECDVELGKSLLSQWPKDWSDLPKAYTQRQEALLNAYDSNPNIARKLWPVDAAQLKAGAWPQYYIGAVPYCFRLPEYPEVAWPPHGQAHPAAHTAVARTETRPLLMGQAPGVHWYHAHKHGSTTINVMNGMTGAFVIEGPYDDALNKYYGTGPTTGPQSWTRSQPVMVINQLGTVPKMFAGGNGVPPPFAVNGRVEPLITMRPGEVQMWRIVNTSWRSGTYLDNFYPEPRPNPPGPWTAAPFKWKQLAQDGVQFPADRYGESDNPHLLLAAGNRADLLIQAPENNTGQAQLYSLQVQDVVTRTSIRPKPPIPSLKTLVTVRVEPGAKVTGNQGSFIPKEQLGTFPAFLTDIKPADVKLKRTVTFASVPPENAVPPASNAPFVMHTIDGKQFDGNIGEVVLLNTIEEWKIENATTTPQATDHPFHIHINPFQIVEVFDPNEMVTNTSGVLVSKYVTPTVKNPTAPPDPATQCLIDPDREETWIDCHRSEPTNNIWWDVFPIPMGVKKTTSENKPVLIPGYFRMRSRFVDYSGQYVIHCHVLAHEDRGMMTVVDVVPFTTPYSHQ